MDHQAEARERDPLVELVDIKRTERASSEEIVAVLLRALADDVPEHYGPEAQATYRRWLRRRAQLAASERAYVPAVLASSWQWD